MAAEFFAVAVSQGGNYYAQRATKRKEPTISPTVNPEIVELRQQTTANTKEIAELRGNVPQLNQLAKVASCQSTLPIAAIVISLCLTIAGGLYFQTNALDRRIEQLEKRLDGQIGQLEKRLEQVEDNLDELNKELRTQRQAK